MAARSLAPDLYINRELSWIAFNKRVLSQALDRKDERCFAQQCLRTERPTSKRREDQTLCAVDLG